MTAAAVGIAAAILAWNRWITADSMLFGLLLAGLIGLAVAGVVFLVCKVFSYYRKKGTLKHRSFPSSLRKVEFSLLLRWRESFFRWMESRIRYFRRRFWAKAVPLNRIRERSMLRQTV